MKKLWNRFVDWAVSGSETRFIICAYVLPAILSTTPALVFVAFIYGWM